MVEAEYWGEHRGDSLSGSMQKPSQDARHEPIHIAAKDHRYRRAERRRQINACAVSSTRCFRSDGFVNADTIAEGLSAFEPQSAAMEAGRVMLRRTRNLIEQRRTFAFESTLSGRTPARWIDLAKREGFEFHLLFLWLQSSELAIERVAERARRGGHDVPEDVIRRRYRMGIRNFFEIYQPQADEWMVFDVSLSEPDLIATGRSNNVSTIYWPDKWQRICEVVK